MVSSHVLKLCTHVFSTPVRDTRAAHLILLDA